MIKNLFYIVIGLLIFAGCSKSPKSSTAPTSAIIGKWNLSADSVVQYQNGVRTIDDIDFSPAGNYRLFNADGTGVDYEPADSSGPALSLNLTWSMSANTISFNYPAYTYGGFNNAARTDVYNIITLTSNKLGIKFVEGTDDGTQNSFIQYYWYTK